MSEKERKVHEENFKKKEQSLHVSKLDNLLLIFVLNDHKILNIVKIEVIYKTLLTSFAPNRPLIVKIFLFCRRFIVHNEITPISSPSEARANGEKLLQAPVKKEKPKKDKTSSNSKIGGKETTSKSDFFVDFI